MILDWIQVVVLVGIPEILVCPISGDVSCVWLVREVSARFLTSDTLLFSLLTAVTCEEVLLDLYVDTCPISPSFLIFTSSDSGLRISYFSMIAAWRLSESEFSSTSFSILL